MRKRSDFCGLSVKLGDFKHFKKIEIILKLLENIFPVVSGSGGSKDDPKEYQFWSTQPVPGLHEVLVIHYTTLIQAEPVLRII